MAAKVRRRRDRQMAARARFGAETAARTGNGYVGAKMVRAQLLHYAILRLLGAASLAHFHFFDSFLGSYHKRAFKKAGDCVCPVTTASTRVNACASYSSHNLKCFVADRSLGSPGASHSTGLCLIQESQLEIFYCRPLTWLTMCSSQHRRYRLSTVRPGLKRRDGPRPPRLHQPGICNAKGAYSRLGSLFTRLTQHCS